MTNKTRLRLADRTQQRIEKNHKTKHGGKRIGAGRPRGIHTPIKKVEDWEEIKALPLSDKSFDEHLNLFYQFVNYFN